MGQKVSYIQSGDATDELKKLKLNTRQKGHEEHCKKTPLSVTSGKKKGKIILCVAIWIKSNQEMQALANQWSAVEQWKELLAGKCSSLIYKNLLTSHQALPSFLSAEHHSPLQIKHDSCRSEWQNGNLNDLWRWKKEHFILVTRGNTVQVIMVCYKKNQARSHWSDLNVSFSKLDAYC